MIGHWWNHFFFSSRYVMHIATGAPPSSIWTAWPNEPFLEISLTATATLYVLGWRRLERRVTRHVVPSNRVLAFGGGMVALVIALVSPVATYSGWLFSVHMIQHLLLLLIAPPLLLLGSPMVPMLWGLPTNWRHVVSRCLAPAGSGARLGRLITRPRVAAISYVATIAIWHIPVMYDRAQGRTLTHDLEHVMFFFTALLYWWPVIHPGGGRRRLSYAMAIPYLLPPFLEGMLIGALITFADQPVFTTYTLVPRVSGLSVLDDQQLGGLIMWVPGGMLFLIPLITLLALALQHEERRATKRHQTSP